MIAGDYNRQLGWQTPEWSGFLAFQGSSVLGLCYKVTLPSLRSSPQAERKSKLLPALGRKSRITCPLAEKYLPDIF